MEINNFIISEAKDCLNEVNSIISKTRANCWNLIAVSIAINTFVFDKAQSDDTGILIFPCVISFVFTIIILILLYNSIKGSNIITNGTSPEILEPYSNTGDEYFLSIIKNQYTIAINHNSKIAESFGRVYKKALYCIFLSSSTIIVYFILAFFY